jgi:hypothetical protein
MPTKGINIALKGLEVALIAEKFNQPRLHATVKLKVPLNINAIGTPATSCLQATCHVFVFSIQRSKTTKEELITTLMRL